MNETSWLLAAIWPDPVDSVVPVVAEDPGPEPPAAPALEQAASPVHSPAHSSAAAAAARTTRMTLPSFRRSVCLPNLSYG
jgi:hypothetical protein